MKEKTQPGPVVGILLGDDFDEWLDTLGLSLNTFSRNLIGSWVFNYAQALQVVGVRPVIYCISSRVSIPTRFLHSPTGTRMVVLPPSRLYRLAKQWLFKYINSTPPHGRHNPQSTLIKSVWSRIVQLSKWYLSMPVFVLFRELRSDECRSLLVQEYESVRFDLCALFGRLRDVAVFGTFTGGVPTRWIARPLRRVGLKLCAGLAIGAGRETERVRAQYCLPQDKLSLIYSAVDLDVYYPSSKNEERKALGIPVHAKVAMYHGRIELSYKGLDVLLLAWDLICRRYLDEEVLLLVIGTGPDAQSFSKLITDKQLRGVRWRNEWVHDRELIRRHLSAADVYAFPSRDDACPNAVIEAMACGLPVVASDRNGISDILEGGELSGGLLVPPGDPRALAEALGRLFDDQLFTQKLSRRARCRAANQFSMEIVGNQLISFLLNGRR
jgi:glycosyltransferase involved in cell wall biosynthesis